jgi:hypothetical protein
LFKAVALVEDNMVEEVAVVICQTSHNLLKLVIQYLLKHTLLV